MPVSVHIDTEYPSGHTDCITHNSSTLSYEDVERYYMENTTLNLDGTFRRVRYIHNMFCNSDNCTRVVDTIRLEKRE